MADKPDAEELKKCNRWFAVESNNLAWALAEKTDRSADDSARMLDAAHAASYHWRQAGTDLNAARADMLLGHVHALVGNGALAMRFARSSYAFVVGRKSDAWEVAMAHAVLANAACAADEADLYHEHYGIAKGLGAALDTGDREIFDATFRVIPVPK